MNFTSSGSCFANYNPEEQDHLSFEPCSNH